LIRSLYSTAIRLYYGKKYTEARELISACIDMGLPEAIYTMGCLYEFGITLPPNRETAVRYYKKAAELGYRDRRGAHKQWLLKKSK
jgi:TPR repeat protein